MNIALLIEYDGSHFHGFQSQGTSRTVQTAVEDALTIVADTPVRITCAGRTDTGVHATYQVVSFHAKKFRSTDAWVKGTNSNLPTDIAAIECQEVDPAFHARTSALWRRYLYLFYETPVVPAFETSLVTCVETPMDIESMRTAAECFLGERDFSSFRAAKCESNSPNRLVTHLDVVKQGGMVAIDIVANAFLMKMVRNIAGTLLDVGLGRYDPHRVVWLINAKDRTLAPPTAAPNGLYLIEVGYAIPIFSIQTRIPMVMGPDCSTRLDRFPKRPGKRFDTTERSDGTG